MTHSDPEVRNIGSRLELFIDQFLIESLNNLRLQLHQPRNVGVALRFDDLWDGPFSNYLTVLLHNEQYFMYYRGKPKLGTAGDADEVACLAMSSDGISWEKAELGLFEAGGTKRNNIILNYTLACGHNFSPFLDTRPSVAPDARFKAVVGMHPEGLVALASPDGIHWRRLHDSPVFTSKAYGFDSQNVAFWSEAEKCYVLYYRTFNPYFHSEHDFGYRWVSRTTSTDFIQWEAPVEMESGEAPLEHLYTNQTHPYFRAPHIYISLAARFQPEKQSLGAREGVTLSGAATYWNDCSDGVLLTSRGGKHYDRTFMESFIRPGLGAQHWVSRTNYPGLGIVPTGQEEMSLYVCREAIQPSAHVARYTLRTDGFASVNAPYAGGELLTRPLTFAGASMVLNYSTSAAGAIRVEIQNKDGVAVPGYGLADSIPITGDEIARAVSWKGNPSLGHMAGHVIRLRFVMNDADLFSLQFRP